MLEHRGANYSEPAFYCTEMEATEAELAGLSMAEEVAWSAEAYRACHDRLVAEGHNLSNYSAVEAAADVADLRVAMGYDEINVYGVSYGTLPVLHLLRDHPEGIRSAIVDSVWPPEINQTNEMLTVIDGMLQSVFAACTADDVCNAAYPELETVFVETLEQLTAEPMTVMVTDQADQSYEVTIDAVKYMQYINDSGFAGEDYGNLPAAIMSVRNGELEAVAQGWLSYIRNWHFAPMAPGSWNNSMGLYNSVIVCKTVTGRTPPRPRRCTMRRTSRPRSRSGPSWPLRKAGWGHVRIGASPRPRRELVHASAVSDVPTLLFVNTFDVFLAPHFGEQAAQSLSQGYLFELPQSHASVMSGCAQEMMAAFWDDPTQSPDASCIDAITLNWVLPE